MTEQATSNQNAATVRAIETVTVAQQDLMAELAEVEQHLHDAIAELFPPFRQMVATQFRSSHALHRAGVVLAAGVAAPDHTTTRRQRIYLAAALEMLHLAISVHIMLADTAASDPVNRSLLGSTILAGDYCFSRSASFAVRTGNATVVEIFSDALKRVSEGHLRHIFTPTAVDYNEDRELFTAGADAAMELANTPERARREIMSLVALLAESTNFPTAATDTLQTLDSQLDRNQLERWRVLLRWRYSA
jgi:hypothetical protein